MQIEITRYPLKHGRMAIIYKKSDKNFKVCREKGTLYSILRVDNSVIMEISMAFSLHCKTNKLPYDLKILLLARDPNGN